MKNHYDRLGLESGADAAAIKRAFRRLTLERHPDQSSSSAAAAEMAELLETREALLAEISRRSQVTLAEFKRSVIAPTLGQVDEILARRLARLVNADSEASVWVTELEHEA